MAEIMKKDSGSSACSGNGHAGMTRSFGSSKKQRRAKELPLFTGTTGYSEEMGDWRIKPSTIIPDGAVFVYGVGETLLGVQ